MFKPIFSSVAAILAFSAFASASDVQRRDQGNSGSNGQGSSDSNGQGPPDTFLWDITSRQGFPAINFDASNANSEVQFKYDFTGVPGPKKYLLPQLYLSDCTTESNSPGALLVNNSTTGQEFDLDVDIVQDLIDSSDYYTAAADGLSAEINFCVRVDYMYTPEGEAVSESINFHETKVTIDVDMTASTFQLTSISAERTDADVQDGVADLSYQVAAYYCDDTYTDLSASPPSYSQGDVLQVCIKIDDSLADQDVFVDDILSFVVSQLGDEALRASPTNAIANRQTDPMTLKVCNDNGQCNVKTQLTSKFFDDLSPGDLQVSGTAVLSFGTSDGPPVGGRKLMKVPVKNMLGQREERRTQEAAESEFVLQASLVSVGTAAAKGSSSSGGVSMGAAVGVVAVVAVAAALVAFVVVRRRRRAQEQDEEDSAKASEETGSDQV